MIRRRAVSAMAMIALGFLVAVPAQAGGFSGGKARAQTVTMRIRNATSVVYQALNGNSNAIGVLSYVPAVTTISDVATLQRLGGVVLNPGQITQFKYVPGAASVAAVNIYDFTYTTAVPANQVSSYNFTGSGTQVGYLDVKAGVPSPTFSGSPTPF